MSITGLYIARHLQQRPLRSSNLRSPDRQSSGPRYDMCLLWHRHEGVGSGGHPRKGGHLRRRPQEDQRGHLHLLVRGVDGSNTQDHQKGQALPDRWKYPLRRHRGGGLDMEKKLFLGAYSL